MPRYALPILHVLLMLLAFAFIAGVIAFAVTGEWATAASCAGVALALWALDLFMAGWR